MGRRQVAVAFAGAVGLAMAAQARINGELAVRLGDGVAAAVISFGGGLALLVVLVPLSGRGRRGLRAVRAALRSHTLRWWHCLGGVCGGFVVATQGLTVGTLGVAVFTVAIVAGQSASSLVVDRFGLGPGGVEPVTLARVLGVVLCVVAVLVAVSDRLTAPGGLALAVLPLLAGLGIAWQQAVNGRVRAAGGSAWPATLLNFLAGTVALLAGWIVVAAIHATLRSPGSWSPGQLGPWPTEPWLYLGGLLGVLVIATAAAVVHLTGVLLLGLAATSGQVLGGLALDLVFPAAAGKPGLPTYAGAVLALVAVGIAASAFRRSVPGAPARSSLPGPVS